MEKSCWKIPFSILQLTNKAKKAIFWSKIHFFRNVARFAPKLLSIRTLLLTYSKLVGTPCSLSIFSFFTLHFSTYFHWVEAHIFFRDERWNCITKERLKENDVTSSKYRGNCPMAKAYFVRNRWEIFNVFLCLQKSFYVHFNWSVHCNSL